MAQPYCDVGDIKPATGDDLKSLSAAAVQRIVENDIDDRDSRTPEAVKIIALVYRVGELTEALARIEKMADTGYSDPKARADVARQFRRIAELAERERAF